MNGKPRRFGLLYSTDSRHPGLRLMADLTKSGLRRECSVVPVAEATYPIAGFATHQDYQATAMASTNVARMRDAGVTTVLWLGGLEVNTGDAATAASWYPEIVVAGDGI